MWVANPLSQDKDKNGNNKECVSSGIKSGADSKQKYHNHEGKM